MGDGQNGTKVSGTGRLVSLISLVMDSSVITSFRNTEVDLWVGELGINIYSYEGRSGGR